MHAQNAWGLDPRLAQWLSMAMGGHRHHHRGHHRRGGPFGPGWGFGPPGGQRGPRARRGDVRAALLTLLAEEPRNGYQLMQEIDRRSGGVWRPSPGSVYPALQQLEDEGLVRAEAEGSRKLFHLTDEGRAAVEARDPAEGAPWDTERGPVDDRVLDLMNAARQAGMALVQIAQVGDEAQIAAAREVLADARRRLYGILADADDADPPEVRRRRRRAYGRRRGGDDSPCARSTATPTRCCAAWPGTRSATAGAPPLRSTGAGGRGPAPGTSRARARPGGQDPIASSSSLS